MSAFAPLVRRPVKQAALAQKPASPRRAGTPQFAGLDAARNPERAASHHEATPPATQVDFDSSDDASELGRLPAGISPKLEIGDAEDRLERDADRIADWVMQSPTPGKIDGEGATEIADDAPEPEESTAGPAIAASADAASLPAGSAPVARRECATCEDDDELRRKVAPTSRAAGDGVTLREPGAARRGGSASQGFADRVWSRIRAAGRPLPEQARGFLEPRLGVDLDGLRIHADAPAGRLARQIHARAFTLGRDIFFAPGELRPQTHAGMRLLAHEVAHTLQPSVLVRRAPATTTAPDASIADSEELGIDFSIGPPRVTIPWRGSPRQSMEHVFDRIFVPGGNDEASRRARVDQVIRKYAMEDGVMHSAARPGETVAVEDFNPAEQQFLVGEIILEEVAGPLGYGDGWDVAWAIIHGGQGQEYDASAKVRPQVELPDVSADPDLDGEVADGSSAAPPETTLPSVTDGASAPEVERLDTILKHDPEWEKLSDADKRLLIEWVKANPGEEPGDVDFTRVTAMMKLGMAVKLSWRYWPGELQDAAFAALTDPTFIAQFMALTSFHVYLWLTPDPSGITKAVAFGLTATLLAMFAWNDIVMFAAAALELIRASARAKTLQELEAAAEQFATKAGEVGFDIMFMIGTFGLGKAIGKVAPWRADKLQRNVEAKQRYLKELNEGDPMRPIDDIKGAKRTGDATTVLDEAYARWDALSQRGLEEMRSQKKQQLQQEAAAKAANTGKPVVPVTDAKVDVAVLGELQKAATTERIAPQDYLQSKALGVEPVGVTQATAAVTRAEMIRDGYAVDPKIQAEIRFRSTYHRLKPFFEELAKNRPMLKRVTDWVKDKGREQIPGIIGEMIARQQLKATLKPNQTVTNNPTLVVEEVPGYRTIADYSAAKAQAGQPAPNPHTLREGGGKLWRVIAEIDNMVFEKGPAGRRIAVVDEVKAGDTSKVKHAIASLKKIKDGLAKVASGNAKLFNDGSRFKLGKEIGSSLEWSQVNSIRYQSRGATNEVGWTHKLPYEAATFKKAVLSLWDEWLPLVDKTVLMTHSADAEVEDDGEDE